MCYVLDFSHFLVLFLVWHAFSLAETRATISSHKPPSVRLDVATIAITNISINFSLAKHAIEQVREGERERKKKTFVDHATFA